MPIRDYSGSPASNTTLSGIDVREGQMTVASTNDALRQMMADIKEVQNTATLASAGTVAIGAANAEQITITGTSTITDFDNVSAGVLRELRFEGVLVLTHNATTFILPGGANITTAANDVAYFRSLGSGAWRCVGYLRSSGQAVATAAASLGQQKTGTSAAVFSTPASVSAVVGGPWVDFASAAVVDLGSSNVANIRITGTVAITSFGTIDSGLTRRVRFADALTLTHNVTSLILPGAANITTAAGDSCVAVSLGGGNWAVVSYQKASGGAVSGGTWVKGTVVTTTDATLSVRTSGAHGLGAIPDMMRVELECVTGEHGFIAGDRIPLDGIHARDITVTQIRADATNVIIETTNNSVPRIAHATDAPPGNSRDITEANWRYRVTPYRFVA